MAMILSPEQQQTVDQAFDRFLDVYTSEYDRETGPGADREDRERAHQSALWEGLAAVLFPPTNGHEPDPTEPLTESDLLAGYGVDLDQRARREPVPPCAPTGPGGERTMSDLIAYVESKSFWRCDVCQREIAQLITGRDHEPHVCSGSTTNGEAATHQPTIMRYVEREHVYPSLAAWRLLTTFDRSDWGLVKQAVEHYAQNRRRHAARRPGVEGAMRSVFERFDAIQRACNWLQRGAPREFRVGGTNVEFAEGPAAAMRSALLDVRDELHALRRDWRPGYSGDVEASQRIDTLTEQLETAISADMAVIA
jgi:hypothetical protein